MLIYVLFLVFVIFGSITFRELRANIKKMEAIFSLYDARDRFFQLVADEVVDLKDPVFGLYFAHINEILNNTIHFRRIQLIGTINASLKVSIRSHDMQRILDSLRYEQADENYEKLVIGEAMADAISHYVGLLAYINTNKINIFK